MPLYTGAHLLDEGKLYDNTRLLERERELTGFVSETHGYIRPPFLAALMWPLSRLPYRNALRVWQIASIAAAAAFVMLWDRRQRTLAALAMLTSIPVLLAWLKGQDVLFLLLVIAVSLRLHSLGKPVAAGAVFALCATKPHLFLLTPVWLLALRDWAFFKGLLYGGAVLAIVSTAVAGVNWPLEMLREVMNPAFSPRLAGMPNLHGALDGLPGALLWELLSSVAVAGAVFIIASRSTFSPALAAGLLGGVLLARHSYVLDLSFLIPAILIILHEATSLTIKVAVALLLAPPLMFLVLQGPPYSTLVTMLCGAALLLWAFECMRRPRVGRAESEALS
jgi:hypothetical protein